MFYSDKAARGGGLPSCEPGRGAFLRQGCTPGSQVCPTRAGFRADRHGCRVEGSKGHGQQARVGAHLVELEVARQVLLNYQGLLHGTVPLHHTAVLVNEELGEVPFDGISQDALPLGLNFHPLPQWVGIIPINTDLAEQIEFDVIAGGELFDLSITPWLLPPELVAREGEDP